MFFQFSWKSRHNISTLKSHLLLDFNQGNARAEGKCCQAQAWAEGVATNLAGALLHPQWMWVGLWATCLAHIILLGVSLTPLRDFYFVLQTWKLRQRVPIGLLPVSGHGKKEGDPEGLPSGLSCGELSLGCIHHHLSEVPRAYSTDWHVEIVPQCS